MAQRWGRPLLDDPCDHGVVVPLLSGAIGDVPVVACTLDEITGTNASSVQGAIDEACLFADALSSLADDRDILFAASAHTSAALTDRAPLTFRAEGLALDEEIKTAMESDVGALEAIPPELWEAGGACGAGPLTALGVLFNGSKATMISYEQPFGVGYLTAEVR